MVGIRLSSIESCTYVYSVVQAGDDLRGAPAQALLVQPVPETPVVAGA